MTDMDYYLLATVLGMAFLAFLVGRAMERAKMRREGKLGIVSVPPQKRLAARKRLYGIHRFVLPGDAVHSEWNPDMRWGTRLVSGGRTLADKEEFLERWIWMPDMFPESRELLRLDEPSPRRVWKTDPLFGRKNYATSTSLTAYKVESLDAYQRFSFKGNGVLAVG